MTFAAPPSELQHVSREVLQEYLRSAVAKLAAAPALANRLGLLSNDVQHAIQATFDDLCAAESRNGPSSQLKLVFRHDCQNLTCLNPRCALCCQNPNKRCPDSVNFASKYLEKNPLKSKCGASIRIEVVNATTGELAHPQLLQDVQLELSMLDGKKYSSLHETGEDVASCELFLTPKGKELLNPGRLGSHTNEFRVRVPLTARGQAVLSTDLNVQVSSEAMLGGQKSPYKLLVRAVNQHTGQEVPYILFVASEDFVVATPRVAKAVKAEIPCVDDPVSKLEDIGEKTQKKLSDIQAAAETCGVHDLIFPERSVLTVGQFKQLVELSNSDPRFNEKLKQFLIPNKAREHVAMAVENDKRLRMWYPEPNNIEGGLLYRSVRARVDLDHPDVLVQHKVLPEGGYSAQPEMTLCSQAQGDKKEAVKRLTVKAKEDWKAADHPNWSIRDMDSAEFLDHVQPGQNGVGYSSIPESRHLEHTLARNSGSGSFGQHLGGSGQLPLQHSAHGSGQLPLQHSAHGSGQFGISPSQSGQLNLSPRPSGQSSGHLGLSPSQGSGQLLEQLLGQRGSNSLTTSAGWQRNAGQFGSPHLSAGQNRSDSPFSLGSSQAFQPNGGASQFGSGLQQPSSNGFAGFPPTSGSSPFLDFSAQQPTMADIFPGQASAQQPATSQAASSSMGHWSSASGTGSGHHFGDNSRSVQGLSSQDSPSIGEGHFGGHLPSTSGAADRLSPALSQGSNPTSNPTAQSFFPNLGSGSLADQLARPGGLDRISSGYAEPGAKRMRSPGQQQADSSSAFQHPSSEIALQQQLLKQRHNSNSSPGFAPPSPFESLGQANADQNHAGGAQAGQAQQQQQQPKQQPQQQPQQQQQQGVQQQQQGVHQQQQEAAQPSQQLGDPNLQKNIIEQLHNLPDVDPAIFEEPYLLSEGSMHFMGEPTSRASGEATSGRPPTNPANPVPQLHNYLNDPRPDPFRNHVRFSPIPQDHDWKQPVASASPSAGSPLRMDHLDSHASHASSGELIPNVDPARAKWAQKERWSSGNIFASFGSRVRRQLGESGKSDGLESMRDISEFLPELEDMDADQMDQQDMS